MQNNFMCNFHQWDRCLRHVEWLAEAWQSQAVFEMELTRSSLCKAGALLTRFKYKAGGPLACHIRGQIWHGNEYGSNYTAPLAEFYGLDSGDGPRRWGDAAALCIPLSLDIFWVRHPSGQRLPKNLIFWLGAPFLQSVFKIQYYRKSKIKKESEYINLLHQHPSDRHADITISSSVKSLWIFGTSCDLQVWTSELLPASERQTWRGPRKSRDELMRRLINSLNTNSLCIYSNSPRLSQTANTGLRLLGVTWTGHLFNPDGR